MHPPHPRIQVALGLTHWGISFQKCPDFRSLTDYLLVSQKHPHIRYCSRKSRGCWEYVIETKLSGTSVIASIKCKLKLKDIYDRFEFPPLTLSENRWLNNS